jgi:hypothetical protein
VGFNCSKTLKKATFGIGENLGSTVSPGNDIYKRQLQGFNFKKGMRTFSQLFCRKKIKIMCFFLQG